MKIDVLQTKAEGTNEFEIYYDDNLKYKAKLPFISIDTPLNLDKLQKIKIYDLDDNEIYSTKYNYIENYKEQFFKMKYLITGSQKFNQLLFISDDKTIKIYYEDTEIWNNRYVIEIDDKRYYCYSIEDGYFRHIPIYDEEVQIGEALKLNIVVDGKDEYCCYLKDGYEKLSDGIVALLLYLDRSAYSSSYIMADSYKISKKYSYNKTNKYYDKNWVINNFGDEFYKKSAEKSKMSLDDLNGIPKDMKKNITILSIIMAVMFTITAFAAIMTLLLVFIIFYYQYN